MYPTNTNNELFVEAKEDCEIISFIYDNIQTKCNSRCKFHEELEHKLPILIMNNTIKLNEETIKDPYQIKSYEQKINMFLIKKS